MLVVLMLLLVILTADADACVMMVYVADEAAALRIRDGWILFLR